MEMVEFTSKIHIWLTFNCDRIGKFVFSLMVKVRIQEEKHVELLKAGKQAKHRLEELAPEIRLKAKGDYSILLISAR